MVMAVALVFSTIMRRASSAAPLCTGILRDGELDGPPISRTAISTGPASTLRRHDRGLQRVDREDLARHVGKRDARGRRHDIAEFDHDRLERERLRPSFHAAPRSRLIAAVLIAGRNEHLERVGVARVDRAIHFRVNAAARDRPDELAPIRD